MHIESISDFRAAIRNGATLADISAKLEQVA